VWVVNRDDHTLSKINPASGKVVRTFGVGIEPLHVAVGVGGVWVTTSDGKILRVDGSGRVVDTVNVGRGPAAIAVGTGSVWVANSLDGTVSRVDSETSAVTATIEVGEGPSGLAVGFDSIWVSNELDGSVAHIDSMTNEIVESIIIGGSPSGVATGPGGVFVAVRPGGETHRGGTLTMLHVEDDYGTLDPALLSPLLIRLVSTTNDGLTAFKKVGGAEGARVVADLATSLPQPTDAGRTYTFRLRRGIRYSTGKPVRAEDFRRALERAFELDPFGTALYNSIEGVDACSSRPKGCDLSKGIVADDRAGTVTFRLTEPDPDLPAKLALPTAFAVPSDTPSKDIGRRPLPATGPYMIASYVPGRQLRLTRNPRFREWSRAAQPEGYPDEIVVKLGVPISAQLRAVARGEADFADPTLSGASEIAGLRARYGSRLHSSPGPIVVYTFLNTQLAPFDDIRVRRALNYAVDREAVVRAFGGPDRAAPSCQILPANYPGYRPYCPYDRDLAEARRLVAASGTRGTPVVVWTRTSYEPFFSHVVRALRALGYPARLKIVDDLTYYEELEKAGVSNVQAGYVGFGAALPSAAEFIESLLDFVGPLAQFSDRSVEREIERALDLQQTDPLAANEIWARVDRMLVEQAPLVPLYNARAAQFVSARVGNYQFHPLWNVLVDQLWVR